MERRPLPGREGEAGTGAQPRDERAAARERLRARRQAPTESTAGERKPERSLPSWLRRPRGTDN